MANREKCYSISEFANMTGLPQSKIRYYEKLGLFTVKRQDNGYRYYTPEDAFRTNAFRSLLLYGFSVEQAIRMLDEKQGTDQFRLSLQEQRQTLAREKQLLEYRLGRLDNALRVLELNDNDPELGSDFALRDYDDILFVYASHGRDFTVSAKVRELLASMVDLLSITSYARVIAKAQLESDCPQVDPSYVIAMPATESWRLSDISSPHLHRLAMGKCLMYHRRVTREESAQRQSFAPMQAWLSTHGYRMRSDFMIFPSFLNLDGQGKDQETVVVPVI